MSHVGYMKTVFTRLDDIESAAQRMGGTLNREARTYRWYGVFVGDSPLPPGVAKTDLGKCNAGEITFPHASYTIGVQRLEGEGYRLLWDSWVEGGLGSYMGDAEGGLFAQAYAIEAAKRRARMEGFMINETTKPSGEIALELIAR